MNFMRRGHRLDSLTSSIMAVTFPFPSNEQFWLEIEEKQFLTPNKHKSLRLVYFSYNNNLFAFYHIPIEQNFRNILKTQLTDYPNHCLKLEEKNLKMRTKI